MFAARFHVLLITIFLLGFSCLLCPATNAEPQMPVPDDQAVVLPSILHDSGVLSLPTDKQIKQELGPYEKWLGEDVHWIIADEERSAFKQLLEDRQRDQFIESFWQRRNPNPENEENVYKEEHYRRIEFANEQFGSGVPGWTTDRGRVYIVYGPPDEIESHGSRTPPGRTQEDGSEDSGFPSEVWRYHYFDHKGLNVLFKFVDGCACGDFRLTLGPLGKDTLPSGSPPKPSDRIETFVQGIRPPVVRFKDLEEIVTHKVDVRLLPFDVRTDFVKATDFTVLMPITVQIKNHDLTFSENGDVERAELQIFGRLETTNGWVVETFEDTVQVDSLQKLLAQVKGNNSIYQKVATLRPGLYWLNVVVRDVNGDRVGTWKRTVQVPEYSDHVLAKSSLVLADRMELVSSDNVPGTGRFLIGRTYVRPCVPPLDGKPIRFKQDQTIDIWMQVYNLGIDPKKQKPSATVQYDVVNLGRNVSVMHAVDSTNHMGHLGNQMTLTKTLNPVSLGSGVYELRIKVNDDVSNHIIEASTTFSVD